MPSMKMSLESEFKKRKLFFLAPLAELTHLPLRLLIEEFGGCDYYFTEMMSAGAVASYTPYERFYLEAGDLAPRTVFQLAGSDEEAFCRASERLMKLPGAGIDINMGCSAFTMVQKGWGICWMQDSQRAFRLISRLRPLVEGRTLSVKMRIGWKEDELAFKEFALALAEGGVDFITLNPQTKKENRGRSGQWQWVKLLKETVSVPVVGNGNIVDEESFAYRSGCGQWSGFNADGYMIGRGAVARPWLFKQLQRFQNGETNPYTVDLMETLLKFQQLFNQFQPQEFWSSRLSRFLFYYTQNLRFGHQVFSQAKSKGRDGEAMLKVVLDYFERHPEERYLRI